MLQDLQGRKITVFLTLSAVGNISVKGTVIQMDESWIQIKGKKEVELVNIQAIKKIIVHDK